MTPALPMRYRCQQSRRSKPATIPQLKNSTYPANSQSALPRISGLVFADVDAYLCARRTEHDRRQWFQNLDTNFKYRVFKNAEHEFVMSVGLASNGVEAAQRMSVPNKGRDLHAYILFRQRSWVTFRSGGSGLSLITGQWVGYALPGKLSDTTFNAGTTASIPEFHPRVLQWVAHAPDIWPTSSSAVIDLGLPDFFNHLIPLVEVSMQMPFRILPYGDHWHRQSWRNMGWQHLSGRCRGHNPDQPAERTPVGLSGKSISSSMTFSPHSLEPIDGNGIASGRPTFGSQL